MMQLTHKDMEALALIDVEALDLPASQAGAVGKVGQSVRHFLAGIEKQGLEPTGKRVKPALVT